MPGGRRNTNTFQSSFSKKREERGSNVCYCFICWVTDPTHALRTIGQLQREADDDHVPSAFRLHLAYDQLPHTLPWNAFERKALEGLWRRCAPDHLITVMKNSLRGNMKGGEGGHHSGGSPSLGTEPLPADARFHNELICFYYVKKEKG